MAVAVATESQRTGRDWNRNLRLLSRVDVGIVALSQTEYRTFKRLKNDSWLTVVRRSICYPRAWLP